MVLLDDRPLVVYRKDRPSIVGDGKRSVLELALAACRPEVADVLSGVIDDLDKAALDEVPPRGSGASLNWRHNLDSGAQAVLLEQGEMRDACVEIAVEAAKRSASASARSTSSRSNGAWKILEINSGVMMEALGKPHPDWSMRPMAPRWTRSSIGRRA